MKEREMFNNFKSDMGMTDVEWRLFCQRYAIRGMHRFLYSHCIHCTKTKGINNGYSTPQRLTMYTEYAIISTVVER